MLPGIPESPAQWAIRRRVARDVRYTCLFRIIGRKGTVVSGRKRPHRTRSQAGPDTAPPAAAPSGPKTPRPREPDRPGGPGAPLPGPVRVRALHRPVAAAVLPADPAEEAGPRRQHRAAPGRAAGGGAGSTRRGAAAPGVRKVSERGTRLRTAGVFAAAGAMVPAVLAGMVVPPHHVAPAARRAERSAGG